MSSGITFSGFNSIDFNVILNAIMTQESRPLQELQTRQKTLQATDTAYGQLATKLDALRTASSDLSSASTFVAHTATSSDTSAITASASSGAVPGRYDVVVTELARAQVTVSTSHTTDTDTTIVATGGTVTIGGVGIAISGPSTLADLAAAINADTASPASASIVETLPGEFHLVLTGKDTGATNSFSIVTSGLTGSSVAFAGNTVNARNADFSINGLGIVSDSNTVDTGIPGVTLELLEANASNTVVINVARDDQHVLDKVDAFAAAYNDLVKFATDQATAAAKGTAGTLGRDAVLRSVRSELRNALTGSFGSGAYAALSEVGIGFDRTGQLTVNRAALGAALAADPSAIEDLFADPATGAFTSIKAILDEYTQTGGFVPSARARLSDEVRRLGQRSDNLSARLAVRRAALQREFIAADAAMSRLNAQKTALEGFATSLSSLF